jgi:hypothetical protein
MVDASYYNVLPRFSTSSAACNLAGESRTGIDVTVSGYPFYWEDLGNSYFQSASGTPSVAQAERLIQARYSGRLNVLRADSSVKSFDWTQVTNDAPSPTYRRSMWDPFKAGCR